MEQTAPASRLGSVARIANATVSVLESVLQETGRESEEASLLLVSFVSVVCSLENEAMTLRRVVAAQSEEMSQASRMNEEMKTSWNHLSDIIAMLQSQLTSVEAKKVHMNNRIRTCDLQTMKT